MKKNIHNIAPKDMKPGDVVLYADDGNYGVERTLPDALVRLVHDESGSSLNTVLTGTGDYVNIPGFTFHEPLNAYLEKGWRRA